MCLSNEGLQLTELSVSRGCKTIAEWMSGRASRYGGGALRGAEVRNEKSDFFSVGQIELKL